MRLATPRSLACSRVTLASADGGQSAGRAPARSAGRERRVPSVEREMANARAKRKCEGHRSCHFVICFANPPDASDVTLRVLLRKIAYLGISIYKSNFGSASRPGSGSGSHHSWLSGYGSAYTFLTMSPRVVPPQMPGRRVFSEEPSCMCCGAVESTLLWVHRRCS